MSERHQTLPVRRLTVVRHGETVGQSSIRYYGSTDIALSNLGIAQMERVRDALCGFSFDTVYTSALSRTTRAAEIIAPIIETRPVEGFNEICFGDWEGLTSQEIAERDPPRHAAWRSNPHEFSYPNGDSVAKFRARVIRTLHELLPSFPASTLLVVHRGIVSTILTELLQLTAEQRTALAIDLASIHVLNTDGSRWHAEALNRIDHLEGVQ